LILVPPKKLAKRKKEDEVKPISGLDIEALLARGGESASAGVSQSKRLKLDGHIDREDPAKDFKRLIDNEENSWKSGNPSISALIKVFKEMETVIREVVTKSYADNSYDKAIKALETYRSEAIDVGLV